MNITNLSNGVIKEEWYLMIQADRNVRLCDNLPPITGKYK